MQINKILIEQYVKEKSITKKQFCNKCDISSITFNNIMSEKAIDYRKKPY